MKVQKSTEIVIEKMDVGVCSFWIKGLTPLIYNSMSAKATHELLFPKGKKTSAERNQCMKHEPEEEYRNSVYVHSPEGKNDATKLCFPAGGIKKAISSAALEVPGAKKAQIGRLVWVDGRNVPVYGVPKLFMSVVRSADMNKTPDVRTRALLPEWCCCVTVKFVKPTMNPTALSLLLETAGLVIGIGDFRQEKGAGNYGQFSIVDEAECADIIKVGGKAAQVAALKNPEPFDDESEKLLTWFNEERKIRGK